MVEHSTADREVPGSIPGAPSFYFLFRIDCFRFFPLVLEPLFPGRTSRVCKGASGIEGILGSQSSLVQRTGRRNRVSQGWLIYCTVIRFERFRVTLFPVLGVTCSVLLLSKVFSPIDSVIVMATCTARCLSSCVLRPSQVVTTQHRCSTACRSSTEVSSSGADQGVHHLVESLPLCRTRPPIVSGLLCERV